MLSRSRLGTLAMIAIYATVMICTNHIYTILDDESTIVAVAGHPTLPTIGLFLSGGHQHEHPPVSDILLHLWLIATGFSFFMLRVFANIFFIAGVYFTARSAQKLAGEAAYWTTLILGFVWPFAFQYGRITGWYCFSMFLVSLVTWLYLQILDDRGYWTWAGFALTGILFVWSNYFGVAVLALLLLDFLIFHRTQARKDLKPLLITSAAIVASFLPLLKIATTTLGTHAAPVTSHVNWKNAIATVGYPVFSIFGSAAVAPWFLPLSIPILLAAIVLVVSIWFSPGRKWMVYYVAAMVLLGLSGHLDIKRALFLLPWFFLAIVVSLTSDGNYYPRLASAAIAVMVILGWIGIVSGNHYATTNLREPWQRVAQVVSGDARRGATVISENPPFFFYLDYQLGLESESANAPTAYLGENLYRSHGYKILVPDADPHLAEELRGKVVLVNGSATKSQVETTNVLSEKLHERCKIVGEYRTAPDPAAALKKQFAEKAPVFAYRVNVTWFDCGNNAQ